jgi:hypothetical protein
MAQVALLSIAAKGPEGSVPESRGKRKWRNLRLANRNPSIAGSRRARAWCAIGCAASGFGRVSSQVGRGGLAWWEVPCEVGAGRRSAGQGGQLGQPTRASYKVEAGRSIWSCRKS